ncbi:MAG: SAM-dependent chlorinase/fluorinase [Anaerolineae bacterium]|nr:SAM-dependent chlorinase/fluorinase [Anaerolineae bacterium]
MSIITLTTDFGLADGYVGTMKGVILSIAPQAHIVDISHDVGPQNVRQAAYVLSTAAPYFPPGSIHVVVVDPGVGSARRPIAVRTERAYFVGPDNGVFSYVLTGRDPGSEIGDQGSGEQPVTWNSKPETTILHLDRPQFWLPTISRTFHGRDIFSPVAAHLAAGVPFDTLGTPIADPVILPLPRPERRPDGSIRGQVLHADRFGNLITDIPVGWLAAGKSWRFDIAGQCIEGLSLTYAAAGQGELVALPGSDGLLEIAVREGSAAKMLHVGAGAQVIAMPEETR